MAVARREIINQPIKFKSDYTQTMVTMGTVPMNAAHKIKAWLTEKIDHTQGFHMLSEAPHLFAKNVNTFG